ncbi:hypothetical protein N7492_008543 [Penicillium capsulatum]|uniref:Guanine nucleotide exchange factor n=1 Tax=Penicillium capsulatum TaxID=69766 RepID=A0A9W9LHD3_9EURO|nr:hypothetical protein N7492_008543 [Penicillium capsulatum]KAJ6105948.1 hypothetical protein N7512_009465 [Penicillium capsulatum]
MEPVPSSLESPVQSKDPSAPQVRIDELPALFPTRSGDAGPCPNTTSKLRRANTVAQAGNMIKRNLELKATRERTATTGLPTKDSNELLRKSSLKRSQTHRGPLEARPAGRKAGHFTVGSVGQNGKIFLRPIANPPKKETVPFSPSDQVTSDLLQPQARTQDDSSRWSSSQLSELRPRDISNRNIESIAPDAPRPESATQSRQRANSFSTMSDKQSAPGVGKRGELRIVINRSEDRPKTAEEKPGPLDVPIPHRLGSPRFNPEGSAALQTSVYARTSMSDNFRNSSWLGGMADPLPTHLSSPYCRESLARNRSSFALSLFSGTAAIDMSRASPAPRNSVVYELKEPVDPSIYEVLVSDMDGESVVRYIPGSKDISAATPARIVAQISSESFMDYELVSDFFLTFRSYLSPSHLLALLLARLQWAINRLQEDGRIIRIRTFAALRHWILNYFVDDFVTNYGLRTHFCETINALYQDVKSRSNGGMSDLKILLDLKRCWNGKCSLYWTTPELSRAYSDPDSPIVPGNAELELPGDSLGQETAPLPGSVTHAGNELGDDVRTPTQHDRNDSRATAQSIPFSTKSDQSILALSCSLPPKSPKRFSASYSKSKAPRPVPLTLTKSTSPHEPPPTSPMSRHQYSGHGHKRSGSFSDSVRDDRMPMAGMDVRSPGLAPQEMLDPVSFIRGGLYPPAESYMTVMAPDSPPLPIPSSSSNPDRRSTPDGGPKSTQSTVGMRTFIGSIKRALHTRNGGNSVSARIANASEALSFPSRGKTSAMPNNVALGSELYRERKLAAVPKRPARIDLLCDEALKQYRQAMNSNLSGQDLQPALTSPNPHKTSPGVAPRPINTSNLQLPPDGHQKIPSGLTTGSGSIVIVDDTGFEFPIATDGVPESDGKPAEQSRESFGYTSAPAPMSNPANPGDGECLLPIYYNGAATDIAPTPSEPSSQRRSFSIESQTPPRKRASLSLRLRKYASFQSGISRQRASMKSDTGASSIDHKLGRDAADKPGGPVLRRRPGGNLRRMQLGGDIESGSGRRSLVSKHSYNDSLAETTSTIDDVTSRPLTTLIPPNPRYSLIQGGSARHLRRSFESALARFAQIPDDEDGGIESTLLKLEGKWPSSPTSDQGFGFDTEDPRIPANAKYVADRRRQTDMSAYSTIGGRLAPPRPYSDSVAESEESYNSIPLLERGLTDDSMKRPPTNHARGVPLSFISSRDTSELASSHPSIQIVQETESIRRIPRGATVPEPVRQDTGEPTQRHLSAPISDLSVDVIDAREAMDGRASMDTRSFTSSTVDIPPHPLAHPPSPPMTIQHPGSFTSCPSPMDKVLIQAQPLTPDTSPRRREGETSNNPPRKLPHFSSNVLSNSEKDHRSQVIFNQIGPDHVPFILACESQMLAQQLTLVEMAALSEVDWRDLVEMRWSGGSQCIVSWVQFLAAEEHKGIDLVVGRFNLMVKWVLSEIILTRDIHERARTVSKFIHTAAHARRICNYATMLQIAIALSSSDCSRLQNTWQIVPIEDKRLFKDMECLIQPVRNFNDLRVEMETANLQEGCIPFIGLYVHDLTYNSQKPAQLKSSDGGSLINFERYRTAARIVKSLLRLIDASTKYRFEPVQGVIERCLWISSLPEGEIQARSKQLE